MLRKCISISRSLSKNGQRRQPRQCSSFASPDVFPQRHDDSAAIPFITWANFIDPKDQPIIPCYRVLNARGQVVPKAKLPHIDEELLIQMYSYMIRLNTMDNIFYDAQRQGRISFYMTSYGEEAIHIGSSAALSSRDMVFAQYREQGILMWRGFSLTQFADQCFSNEGDPGKGRQMPVHYGSSELNYQTISSPLGTQLPQATGAAYAMKLEQLSQDTPDRMAVCYFGEGAASEGDFHAALNFAATRECPVLFFCRNNGFAISTPIEDQFRGDGIASRAAGYGMPVIRIDGNDLFAVYDATKKARAMILEHQRPVMIEAMTYRQGHHSTSDDSTRYREVSEIKDWKEQYDPVMRLKNYLIGEKIWTESQDLRLRDAERRNVLEALQTSEKKQKPGLDTMFEDVYASKPVHLQEQEAEMLAHVAKYPDEYSNTGH